MSLYKRGSFWWSRIVRNGESFSRSTKCKNKADAIRVESNWIQTAEHGVSLRRTLPTTLSQFETRFFEYVETNVASPKTKAYYKTHWTPLRASALGIMDIGRITPANIHTWVQARSKDVGPASVNGSLRTLRRAVRLAHEWGVIKSVPKIRTVKGEKSREFVVDEKLLTKMLAHEKCTPVLKRLLPFLFDTGLRLGEAMSLDWSDVNLSPSSLFVTRGKTKAARRTVPLTDRVKSLLEEVEAKDRKGRVFEFSAFTVSHQFLKLRDVLGLSKECVLHSMRHTFCSRLGAAGVSAHQLMRLAGHSSLAVSQRYVHEDQQSLRDSIALLN